MARNTDLLTARQVTGNLAPGRYSDGGNLYLIVSKTGAKSWLFIYRSGGRQREMGLGSFDRVSLKAARAVAAEAREILGRKLDPVEERRAAEKRAEDARKAEEAEAAKDTFGTLAMKLLHGYTETNAKGREIRVPGWADGYRNVKHIAQWESTLREYASPLWDMRLDEIDVDHVLGCIQPIWLSKQETAGRVRGRIERVLAAATVRKLRKGPNPATWNGNLRELLSQRTKLQRGHHPALPWRGTPDLWPKLATLNSVSALCLRFTILTAARSGEARGARWTEIDREEKTWTVPKERMKAGREHVVPLSEEALALLDEAADLRQTDEPNELVFPSTRDRKCLSDMALAMCLRGVKSGITVHGFRSTFRDWAGDATPHAREVVEQALAHTVRGVEGAYRRGTALEKRRALMADWASFIANKPSGNVLRFEERATA
jgi:integrase/plasmid stability protein